METGYAELESWGMGGRLGRKESLRNPRVPVLRPIQKSNESLTVKKVEGRGSVLSGQSFAFTLL